MKKKGFKGWNDVCAFTFRQNVRKTGYKAVTTIISFLIIAAIIAVIIILAYNDNKKSKDEMEEYVSPIQAVYIIDKSGYLEDFNQYAETLLEGVFDDTNFIYVYDEKDLETREKWLETALKDEKEAVVIYVSLDNAGYVIEALVPDNSNYKENDCNKLTSHMLSYFEMNKLTKVLSPEQAAEVLRPTTSSFDTIGDDGNVAVTLIKMFGPMIFGLLLYMMLILYGQNIAKEVSMEKMSKLVETLLVSIHPNALITGKVIAIALTAIIQFLTWIASVIIGFVAGNAIAHLLYPEYENVIVTVIKFLRDNISETALSLPSILLAIVIFCIGFLFYSFLAGLSGCMMGRPDEASSAAVFFQLPVIISWLVTYMSTLMEKEALVKVLRYIPLTAPFSVPMDLISGTIGIWQGLVALLILLVFSYFVIILSVKVYKGLVLYTGQKVSLKLIGKILKA